MGCVVQFGPAPLNARIAIASPIDLVPVVGECCVCSDDPFTGAWVDRRTVGHTPRRRVKGLGDICGEQPPGTLERYGISNDAVSLSVVSRDLIRLTRAEDPQFVVVLLPERRTVQHVPRSSVFDERVGGFGRQIPWPVGTRAIGKLIPVVVRIHPYGNAELLCVTGALDPDRSRFR